MKRVLVLSAVIAFAAVSASFANAIYYSQILGGGIIVEQEKLNPFNPAGVQFKPNFFQLEVRSAAAAANVTDPTGSTDVMLAFPAIVSYKFSDLLGLRLGIFNTADSAANIDTKKAASFASAHRNTALSPMSILEITYALKLGEIGIGLKYNPEISSQGTFKNDNFSASYMKHKIEPGVVVNMGNLALNAIGKVYLEFLNVNEAFTNAQTTNSLTLKSPFELLGLKLQASYKLSEKILLAARLEGGMLNDGLDFKGVTAGVGNTNSSEITAGFVNIIAAMKLSPAPIIDAYLDLGAKFYGHSSITYSPTATNTNTILNQMSLPSLAVGINLKPGDFRFKLGFAQEIVATTAPYPFTISFLTSGYELDTSVNGTAIDFDTLYSIKRTASAGISYQTEGFVLDVLLDISTSSFLGEETRNPLQALAHIFNSGNSVTPTMFTGVRVSFLF
jgi:hypothetical protein